MSEQSLILFDQTNSNRNRKIKKTKKSPETLPSKNLDDDEDDPFGPLKSMMRAPAMSEKEHNHIYFYTEVDKDTCLDLNRKINELNKDLLKHSIEYEIEPPNIYLHINSFGGSLFAAFSTIDTIMNSRIPIISIIEGGAASAATIISMVCHKRYITPSSFMLIHQLSTGASGKYEEMKDDFMNDTALMDLLYKLYLEHTTMDLKTIKRVLKRDLWWDASKCLENGLVDDIYKGNFMNISLKKHFNEDIFESYKTLDLARKGKRNSIETVLNALTTISSSKRKRIDSILAEPDPDQDSDDEDMEDKEDKDKKESDKKEKDKKDKEESDKKKNLPIKITKKKRQKRI
jgi:ATP-dependent protease ClpP protease subunit